MSVAVWVAAGSLGIALLYVVAKVASTIINRTISTDRIDLLEGRVKDLEGALRSAQADIASERRVCSEKLAQLQSEVDQQKGKVAVLTADLSRQLLDGVSRLIREQGRPA